METITNYKRIAGILSIIIMIAFMATPLAYADGETDMNTNEGVQTAKELKLKESSPENNNTRLQMDNSGIKLFFDGNVIDKSVWKNNKTKFKLTTKKGKAVKTQAYSSQKSGTDYILVVVDSGVSLKSKTDYIFTIEAGLQSKEGQILSEDIVLNYTTIDMEGNTRVNMGLMAVMVVGMIIMTVVSTRRQEQKKEKEKPESFNPYKIAKETGKSVEEVIAKHEKEMARKAKKAKKKEDNLIDFSPDDDTDTYKVKRARTIAEAGSTYKTGRKAEAEKKAKQEAAKKAKGTTNPKKKGGKKKGKKK